MRSFRYLPIKEKLREKSAQNNFNKNKPDINSVIKTLAFIAQGITIVISALELFSSKDDDSDFDDHSPWII